MYCKNCGNQIIEGTSFCPKCGSQIEQINNNQNMNNNVQYQNNAVYSQTINNQITDEDLKRAYIGEKYDSFKNGGASIFPFLLGAIYLLYRKMYLWGLAWIIINFICSLVPSLGIISLIIMILMIAKVKEFYMKHVEKKINQIKLENPTATKEQLINICSKKGGVNIVVPIVTGSVIFLMVSFACVATPIIMNKIDENRNENNDVTNDNQENASNNNSISLVDAGNLNVNATIKDGNIIITGKDGSKAINKSLNIGNVRSIAVIYYQTVDEPILLYIDEPNYLYRIDLNRDFDASQIMKISDDKVKAFGEQVPGVGGMAIDVVLENGETRTYYPVDCADYSGPDAPRGCGLNESWGTNQEFFLIQDYAAEMNKKYAAYDFGPTLPNDFTSVSQLNNSKYIIYLSTMLSIPMSKKVECPVGFNDPFDGVSAGCVSEKDFAEEVNIYNQYGITDYKSFFQEYFDSTYKYYVVPAYGPSNLAHIIYDVNQKGNEYIASVALVGPYISYSYYENDIYPNLYQIAEEYEIRYKKLDNGQYRMISKKTLYKIS